MNDTSVPSNAVVVIPGSVFVVPRWSSDQPDRGDRVMLEVAPHLDVHRGFRGMPDPLRRTGRFGDPGVTYVYGGRPRPLRPFGPELRSLRDDVAAELGVPFNCAYANLYTSGLAAIPRHSDAPNLPQLGDRPVIAAVSFGASRSFQLWAADEPRNKKRMVSVVLNDGDLCVMHGDSQSAWLHGIPKEPQVTGERLSITFRFHAAA